ncbi:MAG: hypothetical protein SGI90_02100 [Candidatus Eisenbacteria bacterium]|nr:hypothetical protein [Candidatus Eisenbacteria bacterium]
MAATLFPDSQRLASLSQRSMIVGIIGILASAAGLFLAREQFFRSYLTAFFYVAGFGIGSLGILLLHSVVGGNWGVTVRRLLESGARTIPMVGLLFIPLIFGMHDLYLWARPEVVAGDLLLQHKAPYLNVPFLVVRTVVFFGLWSLMAFVVTKMSLAQDTNNDGPLGRRLRRLCGPLIIVHVLMVTFSSFDWIMSLEPHWYSTIFGMLSLAGQNLATMAFLISVVVWLGGDRVVQDAETKQSVYDLGNLLLAFTMFWAYLAFSQLLIIWAGNLPEEIPYFVRRFHDGWGVLGIGIILFHFVVPFLMLINRYVKRNPVTLSRVALLILVMRLVEIFFTVAPAHHEMVPFSVHWLDLTAPIGLGGLWLAAFLHQLKGRGHVPGINHLGLSVNSHLNLRTTSHLLEGKAPHVG